MLEIKDKTGRKIRLTKESWKHITNEHPEITDFEEIKQTLINPLTIKTSTYNTDVRWYYRLNKERKRYLMVSVKYLNGEGFVITAYYMRKIK